MNWLHNIYFYDTTFFKKVKQIFCCQFLKYSIFIIFPHLLQFVIQQTEEGLSLGLFLAPFDFAFQTGKRFEKQALRQNQTPAKQTFKLVSGSAQTRKRMHA